MINRDGIKNILRLSLIVFVIIIVFGYALFSFKDYIEGPVIIINEPVNGSLISTSTVTIRGQVLHIQDVAINNKPILIDKQGNFIQNILLFPGYNVSIISAKDKFKRTIEYKLELVYQDKK